jgi:hypothetical protein
MTDEKMKPCPFCGGEPKCNFVHWGRWIVYCAKHDCPARPHTEHKERCEAIAAWNTRPSEALRLAKEALKATRARPPSYLGGPKVVCTECGGEGISESSPNPEHGDKCPIRLRREALAAIEKEGV